MWSSPDIAAVWACPGSLRGERAAMDDPEERGGPSYDHDKDYEGWGAAHARHIAGCSSWRGPEREKAVRAWT